jgi:hypothetical protein
MRWHDPLGPAQVEGLALGADHDAGDGAVAGQPAGPGGGDRRPEAHVADRDRVGVLPGGGDGGEHESPGE